MISLFLNTSSNFLNIGLAKNNKITKEIYKQLDKDLSKETLYLIKSLLNEENLTPNDLDEIICVKGPGSFTGLRVGVTIAKTMAYFLDKNLYSTSSLDVMATSKQNDIIVPLIDARRGYVYAKIYDKDYNIIMEEKYIKLEELQEKVKELNKKTTYISNNPFEFEVKKYKPDLNRFYKYGTKTKENPMSFVPNYLKKTEAEEKLNDNKDNK